MAKGKITVQRRSDMVNSFEANAARWNEEAKQYAPAGSDVSEKTTSEDDRITALTKQIGELQTQLSAAPRETIVRVDNPVNVQTVAAPKPVSYEGLPDPVQDPAGYGKALGERLLAAAEEQRKFDNARSASAQNTQDQRDALFDDFASRDEYKDIAKDEEGVEFAATKVLKRAAARRRNVNTYMFDQSEQFFKDVATEYKSIFRQPDAEDDDETPARAVREEPEEVTRTGGIPGGNEGGNRAPARQTAQTSDLYTETRAIQKKGGWY